ALVAGIHVFAARRRIKAWMAGTSLHSGSTRVSGHDGPLGRCKPPNPRIAVTNAIQCQLRYRRHRSTGEAVVELANVSLDGKYTLKPGRFYLSGIQALVRLPLMQRARDRAAGRNTAGFISGYRGSPLGGYDNALWRAKALLDANDIRFQPGLNEDLAATAVWGSQPVGLFAGAKVDGVFGIWYGKGPGLDRSLDVLRHGNWAGTSPLGGVLAISGDDHGAQSTTTAYQCEQVFEAAMMPVLNPATVQDFLDFGTLGFAL